jgi:hypothetical protein
MKAYVWTSTTLKELLMSICNFSSFCSLLDRVLLWKYAGMISILKLWTSKTMSSRYLNKLLFTEHEYNDELCVVFLLSFYSTISTYTLRVPLGRSGRLSADVLKQMFHRIHSSIICLFFFVYYLDWMQMWQYPSLSCYLVHWSFHFFACCSSAVESSLTRVIGTTRMIVYVQCIWNKRDW